MGEVGFNQSAWAKMMAGFAHAARSNRPLDEFPEQITLDKNVVHELKTVEVLRTSPCQTVLDLVQRRSQMNWQDYLQHTLDLAFKSPELLLRVRQLEVEANTNLRVQEKQEKERLENKRAVALYWLSAPLLQLNPNFKTVLDEDGVMRGYVPRSFKRGRSSLLSTGDEGVDAGAARAKAKARAKGTPRARAKARV